MTTTAPTDEPAVVRQLSTSSADLLDRVLCFPRRRTGQHQRDMVTEVHEGLGEAYPAVATSIPHARTAVTQFASRNGITGESLDAIRLAISEAVTNAVQYAYPGRTGAFHVTMAVTGDELWVLVADDGCGYKTPSRHSGLGWGLTIIARLSEEYVITERATGGTEVRMRFPIPPPSGEPADR
jgi:anti-sigma regulatory factor (Ser/Thr protein kinase)